MSVCLYFFSVQTNNIQLNSEHDTICLHSMRIFVSFFSPHSMQFFFSLSLSYLYLHSLKKTEKWWIYPYRVFVLSNIQLIMDFIWVHIMKFIYKFHGFHGEHTNQTSKREREESVLVQHNNDENEQQNETSTTKSFSVFWVAVFRLFLTQKSYQNDIFHTTNKAIALLLYFIFHDFGVLICVCQI